MLGKRQLREEVVRRTLGDIRHVVATEPAHSLRAETAEIVAGDDRAAGGRQIVSREQAEQRRLPAPRDADNCGDRTARDVRIDRDERVDNARAGGVPLRHGVQNRDRLRQGGAPPPRHRGER